MVTVWTENCTHRTSKASIECTIAKKSTSKSLRKSFSTVNHSNFHTGSSWSWIALLGGAAAVESRNAPATNGKRKEWRSRKRQIRDYRERLTFLTLSRLVVSWTSWPHTLCAKTSASWYSTSSDTIWTKMRLRCRKRNPRKALLRCLRSSTQKTAGMTTAYCLRSSVVRCK